MDIDSDDGDGFDPLLNSIMDAMSSIKEATADKIYQKIRKEGKTNFSKPQVDRALARALDYGIFEVHNNRYRIRDVNLDDEDTVYQKKNNKNREQTPYRAEDYNRGDLNPERDNQRYRTPSNEDCQICRNCGRRKKPKEICDKKSKRKSNTKDRTPSKSPVSSGENAKLKQSTCKEKNNEDNKKSSTTESTKRVLRKRTPPKEQSRKRKLRSSSSDTERYKKLQKRNPSKKAIPPKPTDSKTKKKPIPAKNDLKLAKQKFTQAKRNTKSGSSANLRKKRPKNNKKKRPARRRNYSIYEENEDEQTAKTSTVQVSKSKEAKSESDLSQCSEKSGDDSKTNEDKNKKREDPSTSKKGDEGDVNKNKSKEIKNSSNRESHVRESDWLNGPEQFHEGTVKQTNNSLLLQPMDSLPCRNPEDTSYFT